MKRYEYMNCKVGRPAFVIFLFAMLLLARDTLFTSVMLGFETSQFLMLGGICLVGAGFLFVHRKDLKALLTDSRMILILLSALVLLLPMMIKGDWQMMYFSILLGLIVAVFLTYFRSLEDVAKVYVVILTVLGVYSMLATYILRILPDRGIFSVPVFFNSKDVMFHYFGLSFVSDSYVKTRNFGIFREPGVYQYFIILALFLNNYRINWSGPKPMWTINVLLGFTMLSTFATGGVAELGLLVLVVFFEKKLYRDKRILWIAVGLVIALIIAIILIMIQKGAIYWELYGMLVYKFSPEADSSSERMEAILVNLDLFRRNPLVGRTVTEVLHSVSNNTSSTLVMFAMTGICGGLLHLASWVALAWDRNRKLWANAALLLLLLVSFNTQNLTADVFLWLFPMMALTERVVPLLENRKKKV